MRRHVDEPDLRDLGQTRAQQLQAVVAAREMRWGEGAEILRVDRRLAGSQDHPHLPTARGERASKRPDAIDHLERHLVRAHQPERRRVQPAIRPDVDLRVGAFTPDVQGDQTIQPHQPVAKRQMVVQEC